MLKRSHETEFIHSLLEMEYLISEADDLGVSVVEKTQEVGGALILVLCLMSGGHVRETVRASVRLVTAAFIAMDFVWADEGLSTTARALHCGQNCTNNRSVLGEIGVERAA